MEERCLFITDVTYKLTLNTQRLLHFKSQPIVSKVEGNKKADQVAVIGENTNGKIDQFNLCQEINHEEKKP